MNPDESAQIAELRAIVESMRRQTETNHGDNKELLQLLRSQIETANQKLYKLLGNGSNGEHGKTQERVEELNHKIEELRDEIKKPHPLSDMQKIIYGGLVSLILYVAYWMFKEVGRIDVEDQKLQTIQQQINTLEHK